MKKRIVEIKQRVSKFEDSHQDDGDCVANVTFNRELPPVLPMQLQSLLNIPGKLSVNPQGFRLQADTIDRLEVAKLAHELAGACNFLIAKYDFG